MKYFHFIFTLILFPVVVAFADLNEGLIAHYSFDGNANDSSGYKNHGIVNGASLTDDRFGNKNSAYSFDGTDDFIKIQHNDILNVSNNFSISFWVYRNSDNGTQTVITKGRDCLNSYFFNSGGRQFAIDYGKTWCGVDRVYQDFPKQEWHFITGIIDNDSGKLLFYLDGNLTQEQAISSYHTTNSYPLIIGRHFTNSNGGGGYTYPFNGIVDDIRMYDRLLSESEIKMLFNANALISGCIKFKNEALNTGNAMLMQSGEIFQNISLDSNGCFNFFNANEDKPFSVLIRKKD